MDLSYDSDSDTSVELVEAPYDKHNTKESKQNSISTMNNSPQLRVLHSCSQCDSAFDDHHLLEKHKELHEKPDDSSKEKHSRH